MTRARALRRGAWARGIAVAALAAALACASSQPPLVVSSPQVGEKNNQSTRVATESRLDWWLGFSKLERRDGRKALRDFGLHAAAGAATATAGRYATGRCGLGFAFVYSAGPGAAREGWQIARDSDHAPHLLDRLVDVLGWSVGGAAAWSLYHTFGC